MGSHSCAREGCSNLPTRYSRIHGYICDECFDELVLLGIGTNVSRFLASPKEPIPDDFSFERFDKEFPKIDDTE